MRVRSPRTCAVHAPTWRAPSATTGPREKKRPYAPPWPAGPTFRAITASRSRPSHPPCPDCGRADREVEDGREKEKQGVTAGGRDPALDQRLLRQMPVLK